MYSSYFELLATKAQVFSNAKKVLDKFGLISYVVNIITRTP